MKKILISLIFLSVILSACSTEEETTDKEVETNYYLSLSGESDHWKLKDYEVMIKSESYKAGNGQLIMKGEDKHIASFFNIDIYSVVDGEKNRFHGLSESSSLSSGTDIAKQSIGTTEGEQDSLRDPAKIDKIYAVVGWNDNEKDSGQKEKIILYNKDKNGDTFLDSE